MRKYNKNKICRNVKVIINDLRGKTTELSQENTELNLHDLLGLYYALDTT